MEEPRVINESSDKWGSWPEVPTGSVRRGAKTVAGGVKDGDNYRESSRRGGPLTTMVLITGPGGGGGGGQRGVSPACSSPPQGLWLNTSGSPGNARCMTSLAASAGGALDAPQTCHLAGTTASHPLPYNSPETKTVFQILLSSYSEEDRIISNNFLGIIYYPLTPPWIYFSAGDHYVNSPQPWQPLVYHL